MTAPIFLSFLGAIPYAETQYYLGDPERPIATTPYVQEALLAHLAAQDKTVGQVWMFVTADAERNNYRGRIKKFEPDTGTAVMDGNGRGLEARLADLKAAGQIGEYEAVPIPDGNTEAEIFKVFGILHEKLSALPEDAEVIFDITYGFRSLPLLCMVLLRYVRTLHGIRLANLYYGNYEVGRHEQQQQVAALRVRGAEPSAIEAVKNAPARSPILDLRAFAELQEWTAAAQMLMENGSAHALAALMPPDKRDIGQAFRDFTDQILTCRGRDLSWRTDMEAMKTAIRELQQQSDIEIPLGPILEKIEQKMAGFSNNTAQNGFAAVQWCIAHGLIQQGYTFLEETCKSFLIERTHHIADINDPLLRESAKTALNAIPRHKWLLRENGKPDDKIDRDATVLMQAVLETYHPELSRAYRRLTGAEGLRNDMNHGGHQPAPKSPDELKRALVAIFSDIQTAIGP